MTQQTEANKPAKKFEPGDDLKLYKAVLLKKNYKGNNVVLTESKEFKEDGFGKIKKFKLSEDIARELNSQEGNTLVRYVKA